MINKSIKLTDAQIEKITLLQEEWGLNFAKSLRKIIDDFVPFPIENSTDSEETKEKNYIYKPEWYKDIEKRFEKLENQFSFWNADETESDISTLKREMEEIKKKVNILVKTSKLFKGHINNNDIHREVK